MDGQCDEGGGEAYRPLQLRSVGPQRSLGMDTASAWTQPRHGRSLGMDAASAWTGHATKRAVRPAIFCNCLVDDDELHVVVDRARHDLRGDAGASADAREGKKGPTAALLHAWL